MDKLIEKYGQPLINLVIKIDDLTIEETSDHEYLEDRILTHLDWATPLWVLGIGKGNQYNN